MYAKFDKIVLYDHTVKFNDRDCSSQKCPSFCVEILYLLGFR